MKTLIALLSISSACLGQHITTVLTLQYDMQTLTAGLMKDLSGNGNNGTLIGALPQTALGTTFNGGELITPASPAIGASAYYTILYCGSNPDGVPFGNLGTIYSEYSVSAGQPNRVTEYQLTVGATSTPADITWPHDWHCWWFERNRETISWGPMDVPGFRTSANIGEIKTAPTYTSIGAQRYGAYSYNQFLTATLGYLEVFAAPTPEGVLSESQLAQEYSWLTTQLSPRGIKLRALTSPLYPSNIWRRQGFLPIPFAGDEEEK